MKRWQVSTHEHWRLQTGYCNLKKNIKAFSLPLEKNVYGIPQTTSDSCKYQRVDFVLPSQSVARSITLKNIKVHICINRPQTHVFIYACLVIVTCCLPYRKTSIKLHHWWRGNRWRVWEYELHNTYKQCDPRAHLKNVLLHFAPTFSRSRIVEHVWFTFTLYTDIGWRRMKVSLWLAHVSVHIYTPHTHMWRWWTWPLGLKEPSTVDQPI